jgi:hypothetical protein
MKKTMFSILICIGSLASAASTQGISAKSLFQSLENAGVQVECGMGHCSLAATDLSCTMKGNSINHRSYKCTLNTEDETGNPSTIDIQGKPAIQLYGSLVKSNAVKDCGMGTCSVEATSVQCQRRNDVAPGESLKYQCELSN